MNDNNYDIKFINRTYEELEQNLSFNFVDSYGIMSSLNPNMRDAMLHNPSGYKKDEVCQIIALDGNKVIGATNIFTGRLKRENEILFVQSGSYLYVHEDYRKESVGAELFYKMSNTHSSGNDLFAGISKMALPLYKALKYQVFEIPRLIYLRKSRSVIESVFHSESPIIKPLILFSDGLLAMHRFFLRCCSIIKYSSYSIEESAVVPQEVEDIVLSENYEYMEMHDKKWFEWHLNYSLSEDDRTKRKLYLVRHEGKVEAFFLVKQEFFEKASSRGFKNVYLGSVMEWGIAKESQLKEKDLVVLSLTCFDKNVDGIQYGCITPQVISQLKRRLFVKVGEANMAVRLNSKEDKSWKNINNWRIRLAASDTALN